MAAPASRRRLPLATELVTELSQRIAAGTYPADSLLPPERALAGKLGVSRPVLREALQRMQSQGLVEIHHGVGVRVVGKCYRPVRESVAFLLPQRAARLRQLMEVRLVVEPEVARLAAERVTKTELRGLTKLQAELAEATDLAEAVRLVRQYQPAREA